jgi:hypothetical protein
MRACDAIMEAVFPSCDRRVKAIYSSVKRSGGQGVSSGSGKRAHASGSPRQIAL